MDGSSAALPAERPLGQVSIQQIEAEITTLSGQLNAATYRWLTLLAEFDRRQGWVASGARSCAHWLNWRCGLNLGAAREKLRAAEALAVLPAMSAAMARGELSYSKVRALTRVATPATEEALLMVGLHGTAHQVEKLVRGFRQATEAAELAREARQQASRSVQWFTDSDGSLVIRARLPAEAGQLFIAALEQSMASQGAENVPAGTFDSSVEQRPSLGMQRADALGSLAESYLVHGPGALAGGDRQQIVVHVDAETLAAHDCGRCEIEDGPAIAVATARRLACDASVVRIIENADGTPLDVGRKTRTVPPALRRALRSRDQGCCRFPGCSHRYYVDAHHVEHWAEGGATSLANLVSLCRFHHRLLHEGGVRIQRLDDGALRFVQPDGQSLDDISMSPAPRTLALFGPEEAAELAAVAAKQRRCGERIDYGLAVEALLGMERVA